jgi:hypothetical protein
MIRFPWLDFEFTNILFALSILFLFIYLRRNQIRELLKNKSKFLALFLVWTLIFFLVLDILAFVLNLQNKLTLN